MENYKFSLVILVLISFLPSSAGEIQITANGESNILFVDSGAKIIFNVTGTENTTSILWDFGRNINGPETRYSNLSEVEHTVHASGRYNITLTANYENDIPVVKDMVLIVSYEETFEENLLEYPQYTKPQKWEKKSIPDVLLTGDHTKIKDWRISQSKYITQRRRPDLWKKYKKNEKY